MGKTINQHYIPQMYLKRFGQGKSNKEKLSVFNLHTGIILDNQNTNNFASSRYFYDISQKELIEVLQEDLIRYPYLRNSTKLEDEQFVEHSLSYEEAAIKQLLDDLELDLQKIYNNTNISLIIIFLHSLSYRTREFRDSMDYISNGLNDFFNTVCDNMNLSEKIRNKTLDEFCCSGKNIQIQQLLSTQAVLDTVKLILENYNLYGAVNNTKLDFVISDDPAKAIRIRFTDICIPISSRKAIVLRAKNKSSFYLSKNMPINNIINLSIESVVAYNRFQLGLGQKYLFGSKLAIEFIKKVWDKQNEEMQKHNK